MNFYRKNSAEPVPKPRKSSTNLMNEIKTNNAQHEIEQAAEITKLQIDLEKLVF